MAQSVKRWTLAQVMISRFLGLGPTSGSVLTAQSLEPPSDSASPSPSAPPQLTLCVSLPLKNKNIKRGAWGIQLVKCLTLTQVLISLLMSLSPALGSVLTAQSLDTASDSVSSSLCAPAPLMLCLFLSLKNK